MHCGGAQERLGRVPVATPVPWRCGTLARMQRFTISLDDALARQFDELIAAKGYENCSEAVRDLIR